MYLAQLNKPNHVGNTMSTPVQTTTASLNNSLNTIQGYQLPPSTPKPLPRLEKPEIVIEPKDEWKIQNPISLIRNSEGKKSAARLQGDGRQRTPITVKVNCLSMKKFDIDKFISLGFFCQR